jgi:hypothetical protein
MTPYSILTVVSRFSLQFFFSGSDSVQSYASLPVNDRGSAITVNVGQCRSILPTLPFV